MSSAAGRAGKQPSDAGSADLRGSSLSSPSPAGSSLPGPDDLEPSGARTGVEHADGSSLTDGELLDLCRSGDQDSWSLLVRRYSALVTTVAIRAGLPAEDARDVAQATFVALLESGTRIRQDERIGSWLVTVAQRLAWRTRRRIERELPESERPEVFADPHDRWERVAALQSGLVVLGGQCRDLIEALYLDPDSPSYAEIARRLGRAVGTIGPTRARCLSKLRTLMGDGSW